VYAQVDRASPALGPEADELFLKFFVFFAGSANRSLHESSIHPLMIRPSLLNL